MSPRRHGSRCAARVPALHHGRAGGRHRCRERCAHSNCVNATQLALILRASIGQSGELERDRSDLPAAQRSPVRHTALGVQVQSQLVRLACSGSVAERCECLRARARGAHAQSVRTPQVGY
jgi:hypothetical protein